MELGLKKNTFAMIISILILSTIIGQAKSETKINGDDLQIVEGFTRFMEMLEQFNRTDSDGEQNLFKNLKSPRVGLTQQEVLDDMYMFSAGLGILSDYNQAYTCLVNISSMVMRFYNLSQIASENANNSNFNYWQFYLNITLAVGNISTTYKGCYLSTQSSLVNFYYYILQYKSPQNYLIYLLPNVLSKAFVMNTWIKRMQALEASGNTTGLWYYYGVIVGQCFFFDIPEAASFQSNLYQGYLQQTPQQSLDMSLAYFSDIMQVFSYAIQAFQKTVSSNLENLEFTDEDIQNMNDIRQMMGNSGNLGSPPNVQLYSAWDYTKFGYEFTYWMIMNIWAYDPNSYFGSCNSAITGLVATIYLFAQYTSIPFNEYTVFTLQEETFALVSVLEYPYPISTFCYSATFEVKYDMAARLQIFTRYPKTIIKNIMYHLGTITMDLMTAPDCAQELDGPCTGKKVGEAFNLIFLP